MKRIILLLFITLPHCIQATNNLNPEQKHLIDSLRTELDQTSDDSIGMHLCLLLAYQWRYISRDSAFLYIEKGLSYPETNLYPVQKANLYYRKANMYIEADYNTSIHYFKLCNELYRSAGKEELMYAGYAHLVELYSRKRAIDSVLYYRDLALKYLPETEDSNLWSTYLDETVSTLYRDLGDKETALKMQRQLYQKYLAAKDSFNIAMNRYRIGVVFDEVEEFDSTIFYLNESLKLKQYLSSDQLAITYNALGNAYTSQGDLGQGIFNIEKALSLIDTIQHPKWAAAIYSSYAYVLNKKGNYKKAARVGERGLLLQGEQEDDHIYYESYAELITSYKNIGNFEKAFYYQTLLMDLQEKTKTTENHRMLSELEMKYATQVKQDRLDIQAEQIKRQRLFSGVIGGLAISLIILSVFIWRSAQRRKKTNQQLFEQSQLLKQLDQAKSRFFTNISHELRTPLTLIIGPLENALNKIKSPQAKSNIQTAIANSKKLNTLVNEILDLSKLDSGKMKIHKSTVHLERFLRRIFFSYHSLAQLRGFILSFSYHLPESLTIKLDTNKFEKVLNNLLSNAFKYSKPGGVITLRAGAKNNFLQIEVNDTGKGIQKTELEKIFDRFYQAENETDPLQGGTGIGLAYAREIAFFLKGNLKVESQLGIGTTFIFSIPLEKVTSINSELVSLNPATEETEETLLTPPILNGVTSTNKLLIVEDNPEMSKFLVESLGSHYECQTAMDCQEAITFLEDEEKIDLIISDVMMPNMDGFSLLKNIHQNEHHKRTPVILLTARAMEEDKLKGFALGVDDYMTKPFSTKELIARINNLLRNKKIRESQEDLPANQSIENDRPLNYEEQLLAKAKDLVFEHLDDNQYKVTDLAKDLNYSTRQLERLLKKLSGLSPVGFIREIRLQKAYRMLEERHFATVAEVRYAVGIENASYFTKKFKERFGVNPGEVGK